MARSMRLNGRANHTPKASASDTASALAATTSRISRVPRCLDALVQLLVLRLDERLRLLRDAGVERIEVAELQRHFAFARQGRFLRRRLIRRLDQRT